LEVAVTKEMDVGTHTVFVGEIIDADILNEKTCMTYDYYHQVKRGTTPKAAPSYVEDKKEAAAKMAKYKCSVCGWIYDPELGDQEGGISPGTLFERLPDEWVCPMCGADKSDFERIE
jgi:rubredoxin